MWCCPLRVIIYLYCAFRYFGRLRVITYLYCDFRYFVFNSV